MWQGYIVQSGISFRVSPSRRGRDRAWADACPGAWRETKGSGNWEDPQIMQRQSHRRAKRRKMICRHMRRRRSHFRRPNGECGKEPRCRWARLRPMHPRLPPTTPIAAFCGAGARRCYIRLRLIPSFASLNSDGPGLPLSAHGSNISPKKPVIRWMSDYPREADHPVDVG